jgi:hypothetical protein
MAAVPVQIDGVFFPANKMQAPVKGTFLGHASIYGLGIGGGPIMPPDGGTGEPPEIWPSPGHPAHPIAPGGRPPGIWGGAPPYPDISPPLPQPPLPEVPPGTPPDTVVKSAEPGAWGYYTDADGSPYSAYRPGPGQAGPKG